MIAVIDLFGPTAQPYETYLVQAELVAGATGTAQETTECDVAGRVVRVELYSEDTLPQNATIKGYEEQALGSIGSRGDFLAYTHPSAGALSKQIYPAVALTGTDGAVISNQYGGVYVAGPVTLALAGANEGDTVEVRVYVSDR